MRRLGVRFYHPEQEYIPTVADADLRAKAKRPTALHRLRDYVPDYRWRSWSFHGAHPLEHLETFSDADHPIDEARHVNEWTIKNKGNRFRGLGRGVADEDSRMRRAAELEELRLELGFTRGSGITLHNEQQGATAEIDRTSSVPVREQIETLVGEKLTEAPDADYFGIHFGPTEFTVTPDQETVDWINWAGRRALEMKPDVDVLINVHITGSQETENFGDLGCPNGTSTQGNLDYYDLAFATDPRLGVSVHTVMFYPLEGPARVYNQQSFAHKLCLMEKASAEGRPMQWFPEGGWWLSFDNTIPVYLPLYMWARERDNVLLKPLLAARGGGSLTGFRMFNTGHEWGYWQQDYAVGLWAWNSDVTMEQVLGELFDPLCDPSQWAQGCWARTTAVEVLAEVMEHQRDFFLEREDWSGRPGGLFSYWAGEDQGDVLAAEGGLEFRPVRVAFQTVREWGDEELDHFEATDLAALVEAIQLHRPWIGRLEAVATTVPAAGQPWLDEVIDGLRINQLRAEHTLNLYQAIVDYRRAELAGSANPAAAASGSWGAAQGDLADAESVIRRREAAYRYPAEQVYGGGLTTSTEVENGTTYGYRVHTKTHLLTYWHNRHEEVRVLVSGGALSDEVGVTEALGAPGDGVTISWPTLPDLEGSISFGEGITATPEQTDVDLGDGPGFWPVTGHLRSDDLEFDVTGGVARSSIRAIMLDDGLTLVEPADPTAQTVLGGVFPIFHFAWLSFPDGVVIGYELGGRVAYEGLVLAPVADGNSLGFTTETFELSVPVPRTGGGEPVYIGLDGCVLTGHLDPTGISSPLGFEGNISIDDLVRALVELAGADEFGGPADARRHPRVRRRRPAPHRPRRRRVRGGAVHPVGSKRPRWGPPLEG